MYNNALSSTFLYFAYGSNMFTFRLKNMNNIMMAKFISVARLDNYRLDFIRFSKFWGGPTATVVPTANCHVWGVIWQLNVNDVHLLDQQEGVEKKIYYPRYVEVLTPYLGKFMCRIYIQKINPLPVGDRDEIPMERWPSWTYKQVIILGAMEHDVPEYYIRKLKKLKDNLEKGCFKMYSILLRYVDADPCLCNGRKKKEKPPTLELKK